MSQQYGRPGHSAAVRFKAVLALMAVGALTVLCLADDRLDGLKNLREQLLKQDAAVAEAQRGANNAEQTRLAAKQAFESADAALLAPLQEEARLRLQIEEAESWLFLHALPAEIAAVMPQRLQMQRDLQQAMQRIERDEESNRLIGNDHPDPQRPLIEYSKALVDGNIEFLRALDAELKRVLPGMRPPAFVPTGGDVEQVRRELGTAWDALQERLNPLRERRTSTLAALRSASDGCASAANAVRLAQRERLRLLYALATDAAPPYLKSIRVEASKDPRGGEERVFYAAAVTEPTEIAEIDREIQFMLEGLPVVYTELSERHKAFMDAEERFKGVAKRWDEANARAMELQDHAYYWHIGLELADATIGIVKDGGTPASIFFEAGWRLYEARTAISSGLTRTDERIEEAPIDQSIIEYRSRLAQQLAVDGTVEMRPEVITNEEWLKRERQWEIDRAAWFSEKGERLTNHIESEQIGEVKKGVIGKTGTGAVRFMGKAILKAGGASREWIKAFDKKIFEPRFDFGALAVSGVEKLNERLALPEPLMRMVRGEDVSGRVIKQAENALADLGKDFAFAAAVTAVKEMAISINQNERARVATEMAMIDIEWLMRRHEYHARGALYRAFRDECANLEAAIGELMQEKGASQAKRALEITRKQTLSTSDALDVHLEFSAPVSLATVRIGERTVSEAADNQPAVTLRIPANMLSEGETALEITCQASIDGPHSALDGDALTIARFNATGYSDASAALFAGHETTPDRAHQLAAAKPVLKLVNAKPAYVINDWLDVEYVLPGSAAHRRVWLTAYPMQEPRDVGLPAGSAGNAQFQVPSRLGAYRLLLLEHDNAEPLASVEFAVAPVVAKDLGKGEFSDAYQVELSDRGQALALSTAPIADGAGRVYLEARDAGMQLIGPRVSIHKAGSTEEFTYTYGGNAIDLPAGPYDFLFGYTVLAEVRGVNIAPGSTQTVTAGSGASAVGRLTIMCNDGVGQPAGYRVSIRRTGEEQELTYTYGGNRVDLPPGTYDVIVGAHPLIERKGVQITAGQETVVTTGGYGRLQLNALDGINQPSGVRVSVHRAGAPEELTYTYGGNLVDLPPDTYDLYYGFFPNIEFKGVRVVAGQVATTTASGYGRLQLNALDGINQPVGVRVSIRRTGAGEEFTYTYGGNHVDLPPGTYELYFGYTPAIEIKGVRVNAGAVTTETASGYGRVTFAMFDGQGQPAGQRVSVRWRGDEELTYTYGGNAVDLPPGAYVAVHRRGEEDIRTSFTITAGANTTVTLRAE